MEVRTAGRMAEPTVEVEWAEVARAAAVLEEAARVAVALAVVAPAAVVLVGEESVEGAWAAA
eukprot:scaffold324256_cov70-Tisochrysis_lutea.AAC.1